jgi:hypothetical protein
MTCHKVVTCAHVLRHILSLLPSTLPWKVWEVVGNEVAESGLPKVIELCLHSPVPRGLSPIEPSFIFLFFLAQLPWDHSWSGTRAHRSAFLFPSLCLWQLQNLALKIAEGK